MAQKKVIIDNAGKLAEIASTDTILPQNLATGTRDNTKFLRDDGTWQTISSTGVAGTLNVNTTSVGNIGTGEDDLITYSVGANTLANNNDYITFEASGSFGGSINSKRLKVKFGSTTIFDSGMLAVTSAAEWVIEGTLIRTSATTFKADVRLNSSFASLSAYADYSTGTETFANALTLKCTGDATADNDIVQEFLIVKLNSQTTDALSSYVTKTSTVLKSLSSNFVTTSSSNTDTNLSFPIAANEVWFMTFDLEVTTGTSSTGVRLQISTPTGATVEGSVSGFNTTVTSIMKSRFNSPNTQANSINNAAATSELRGFVRIKNSSTAGTIAIGCASTTNTTTTTILAGSSIRANITTEV